MEQAQLVIFENRKERSMMCADVAHDWDNQKDIFGKETEKLLCTCQKLFRATMDHEEEDTERLLRKIYGIAKYHHVRIVWNKSRPDYFIVYGKGWFKKRRLALIQC